MTRSMISSDFAWTMEPLEQRLTGAGGGGSVVALLSNENQASFVRKLGKKGFRQFFPVRISSYGLLIE